jgi:hypothetical protein
VYSLTFLGSESSYRAKDTWGSPGCFIAVREGEDDEYVHGKLKEDKLRRLSKGTSLQASSGGTRTSPRTGAWSTMESGFFLRSSSSFFRRWSTKTANQLARRLGEATAEMD